jgi:hypothetical protein
VREDRVHPDKDVGREGVTRCTATKTEDILDILPGQPGKCVPGPLLLFKVNPQVSQDFMELRVVSSGKRLPLGGRGMPYLLYCILDRLLPQELEPPSPKRIIAGTGHSCTVSELSRAGL